MTAARDLFQPILHYYVSMVRGKRTAFLAGPFDTHGEALAKVSDATRQAIDVDPWAHFDAFGTCSLPRRESNPRGVLNSRLGLTGA